MRSFRRSVAPVFFLAGLLALAACGDNGEEAQSVLPEKGVYQGPEDTPLTPEQLNELRNRTLKQSFN